MKKGLLLFSVLLLSVFSHICLAKHWVIENPMQAKNVWLNAQDHDQVTILAGVYSGPWHITKSLTIDAQPNAVLDGEGISTALFISAKNVKVTGLTIRNWGPDIGELHSGVFIEKNASNTVLENLNLSGASFGIWVDGASGTRIRNCKIKGDLTVRSPDRGNGIHLFNVNNTLIENNEIWFTRDGIYIDTSNNNRLTGNHLHDLRYGVHYMYSHHNSVTNNITQRTRTGYALMQSHHLNVKNNISLNDYNYGMLLNYITYSNFQFNFISQVRQGRNPNTNMAVGNVIAGADGKAMFIYNSVFNEISHNQLSQSDLAVHLTGGSYENKIFSNGFVGNRNQVKFVPNTPQEWSYNGMGNYWSDYLGWDLNEDGLGDSQYIPNNAIDKLLWKYPSARMLFNSPGILLLRWVESQFPIFKKPGITDSHPLMALPDNAPNGQEIVKITEDQTHGG